MAQSLSFCTACDLSNPVRWKCLDCDFCICDSCKSVHQRIPASKNHIVIDIKDLDATTVSQHERKIFEICEEHLENITLYCSTCCVFVCSDCIAESHRKHELDKIGHVFQQKQESMEALLGQLNGMRESLLLQKARLLEASTDFETDMDQLQGTLKLREITLKNEVENHIKECMSEVEMKKDLVLTEVKNGKREIDLSMSKVDNVISTVRAFNEKQDISRFLATEGIVNGIPPMKLSISFPKVNYMMANTDKFGKIDSEDNMLTITVELQKKVKDIWDARGKNTTGQGQAINNSKEKQNRKLDEDVTEKIDTTCPLCQKSVTDQRTLHTCGHSFCYLCIKDSFMKRECPVCRQSYKYILKKIPHLYTEMNEMKYNDFTILTFRCWPGGFRKREQSFQAKLPNTIRGEVVHRLLKKAYSMGLLFTKDGGLKTVRLVDEAYRKVIVKWKSDTYGYAGRHVLPSEDELACVIMLLESHGVTEVDI